MFFLTNKRKKIIIKKIDQNEAENRWCDIISLINIIPHLNSSKDELFHERNPQYSKWEHSLGAYNENNDLVGIILVYYRKKDELHDIDSLYIHRLAVKSDYQNEGIGKCLINNIIKKGFNSIKELQYVSIQTNLEDRNKYVIDFYHKIGFENKYTIEYPDKVDILMIFSREKFFKHSGVKLQ